MAGKREGAKETAVALAVSGGLLAIIMIAEARRARAGAPVVTRGSGRWATARVHVGDTYVEYPPLLLEYIRQVLSEYDAMAQREKAAKMKGEHYHA